MTNQQLFDKVAKHLLTQNDVSYAEYHTCEGGGCAYRGLNGRKCAAGCLIADEHYHQGLENRLVTDPDVTEALCLSGVDKTQMALVDQLQKIHDTQSIDSWRGALGAFARQHGLDSSVLNP